MGQQKLTICSAAWYDGPTPKGVRKGAVTAVSPQSKSNKLMLTVWKPAKRSTRFYGEYVGRKDQAYKKLPEEVSHPASPPFAGKWLTAVYGTAPLSGPVLGHVYHNMLC